jgi:NAD(P)-dependent dehydrogenase (short-subunit alcohol dehydrogenase family)
MPGRLQNKIAVITGASSGIGRATALAFASEGASLVCSDLHETARQEYATDTSPLTTIQAVQNLGAKAIFVKCNTTSSTEVEALIQATVKEYGRIDIMVNNAGIAMEAGEHGSRPIWDYEGNAFDKTVDVNVKGVFWGTKYASKQMVGQEPGAGGDRGWIINLSSVYGMRGSIGISGYVTSKHAVLGLTKAAAQDCAPYRVHVNALCPGFTATAFISGLLTPEAAEQKKIVEQRHPFGGLGTPQDIAKAAVFLASDDAAWVTGIGLPVDGGFSSM